MDNIIEAILKIDSDAQSKMAAAEAQKNQLLADAKAAEEKIINDRIRDADEELKKREENERISTEKKKAEINEYKANELARLDRLYSERHTDWENQIFESITAV